MRIVVHGGMHKTGTKTLQHAMARSAKDLLRLGVCYPLTETGHHASLLGSRRASWSAEVLRLVIEAAKRHDAEVLFLSAEAVSTLSAQDLTDIVRCFDGHPISLLYCFRHWRSFLPSRWAQNATRRDTQSFASYCRAIASPDFHHIDLEFRLVIRRALEAGVADVRAVSFDNALDVLGGPTGAMLSAAGLDEVQTTLVLGNERRTNEREPWVRIETYRLLNGILANRHGKGQDELCRSVGEARGCSDFFDLRHRRLNVPEDQWAELEAIFIAHQVTLPVEPLVPIAAAEQRLQEYKKHFRNARGEQLFMPSAARPVTSTDLDWREFQSRYGKIADATLTAMGAA